MIPFALPPMDVLQTRASYACEIRGDDAAGGLARLGISYVESGFDLAQPNAPRRVDALKLENTDNIAHEVDTMFRGATFLGQISRTGVVEILSQDRGPKVPDIWLRMVPAAGDNTGAQYDIAISYLLTSHPIISEQLFGTCAKSWIRVTETKQ